MAILVVDDQPVNRIVIAKLLRSLNLDVIEACDGRQGLQAYLQHGRTAIAFVFLDLMMPVCDGFHAAARIRSVESRRGWLPVPIVAYTSEDVRRGSPTWLQCMHAGFNDVVPKPMDKQHAVQLLYSWLPDLRRCQRSDSHSSSETETALGSPAAARLRTHGTSSSCSTLPTGAARCGPSSAGASSSSSGSGGEDAASLAPASRSEASHPRLP